MPTLDTNVLLRWMLDDVPEQTALANRVIESELDLSVPDVALIECVYVLERVMRLPRDLICELVGALSSRSNLRFSRDVWTEVLGQYLRHPKLSVADIFLAVGADASASGPLLTFDKKLASQIPAAQLLR